MKKLALIAAMLLGCEDNIPTRVCDPAVGLCMNRVKKGCGRNCTFEYWWLDITLPLDLCRAKLDQHNWRPQ